MQQHLVSGSQWSDECAAATADTWVQVVATLQVAPAAVEQTQDPHRQRACFEMQCQECGNHSLNGWPDPQSRFYCTGCWDKWKEAAANVRAPDRGLMERQAVRILMRQQERHLTDPLVMEDCCVSVMQLLQLEHPTKDVCLVVIGCSGCLERSSSVSGLLSHTDFATVFLEKPDMASHGLDELCAKNVASRWVRRALS